MITVEHPLKNKKQFFDTVADNWSSEHSEQNTEILQYTISETLKAAPGKTILDIGCGTGITFPYLNDYEVIALDLSSKMIEQAKANRISSVNLLLQADTHRIPLKTETIDGIIALAVYPHVIDKAIFLDECHRVLRPGGSFGIIHLHPSHEINRIHRETGGVLEDDFLPEPQEVVRQLEATQFEPIRVEHDNFYFILSKRV